MCSDRISRWYNRIPDFEPSDEPSLNQQIEKRKTLPALTGGIELERPEGKCPEETSNNENDELQTLPATPQVPQRRVSQRSTKNVPPLRFTYKVGTNYVRKLENWEEMMQMATREQRIRCAAAEEEIKPLNNYQVWELTELPPGRRAITCKWVEKRIGQERIILTSLICKHRVTLKQLLTDMNILAREPTIMFEDNQGCITSGARNKHIDVCYHHIRDLLDNKIIDVRYCPSDQLLADVLTKPLAREQFEFFVERLGFPRCSEEGCRD
ncbi:hypothetical protein KM043_008030 [Ampulex compressa]|nr:hypothetical protein KM043_008030 [Ampulex compressa]